MVTLQKVHENPLKSIFAFKPGIKSLSTCLPVGIEIVPPLYSASRFGLMYLLFTALFIGLVVHFELLV